ncbi:type 4a pilus biogenesis protein PilO [Naasia lichenicola]|uniref:Pilus assembly protein PilO n=1 Tax=Naasia lichenicola TaxID=2565933 RepID=A0A4V3WSW3_9MICO|nr:type 4a pilus biogenesis protein PilO [Naasia lichenicola]THG29657.1 hypothetical protein E6C64_13385 [Naasia lichenicola]
MNIALDHRTKVIIGAVFMVLLVVGGWFLGVSPQLDSRALALAQIANVAVANEAAAAKLGALSAAADTLPALESQLATLDASVPSNADSAALLSQINAIAASAGVVVDGVKLEDATAYTPPPPADPSVATTDGTASAATAYSDPRITAGNFIQIPVTVSVTGSYENVQAFLAGLQNGSRLFLVNSFQSTRNASEDGSSTTITADSSVSAVIGGFVYVLLSSEDASANATAAADATAAAG